MMQLIRKNLLWGMCLVVAVAIVGGAAVGQIMPRAGATAESAGATRPCLITPIRPPLVSPIVP